MKKTCLFTLSLVTFFAVFAQQEPQLRTPMAKKVMFGIDAGVNLATLDAKDFAQEPNTNMKTSFHAGVFADIPLGGVFHLEPSIVYSAQGSKYSEKVPVSGTTVNFEEDLHYIYVAPVKLKVMSPSGFFVETGPQLGFLVKANLENSFTDDEEDIKDSRKTTDFLWSAGLGYMSRIGLAIHGRYNYGFSNVLNADDDNNQQPGKMQNRVIQIGLAYHFGAHK